jgi:DNA-binding transcriptional LysR family regulator
VTDPLFDDLPSLLCFARVVETGSFTKAAMLLGISKSVVSTRVSLLEDRIGEPLLLRTTRQVTVTTVGARIYPHARTMAEHGAQATTGATSQARGTIRVSAPVTLSQMCLAEPLREFLTGRPDARVELLLNDRLVDLVEERIDLAVRITKLRDSSLIARRLASTPIDICGAPSYLTRHGRPKRPEDLTRHNCLRYALLRANHEWRLYRGARRLEIGVQGNFETTNGTMLREAAIAGTGLAILPRFMTFDALRAGLLERVLEDFAPPPIGIYAVRVGRRTPSPVLAALTRSLEEAFRRQPWTSNSA